MNTYTLRIIGQKVLLGLCAALIAVTAITHPVYASDAWDLIRRRWL